MGEFDAKVAWVLKQLIIPTGAIVFLLCYVWKNYKSLRQKVFARFFERISAGYSRSLEGNKEVLFHELPDLKSLDWDARNRGHVRILEIGVGPGSNFRFYPGNSRLIAVEPNPNFRRNFVLNSERFPHVVLERQVMEEGENMKSVADASVDVVITTAVLCSVRDVPAVLAEVRRVLKPGGTYFFMEHVLGEKGTWCHIMQHILRAVWFLFLECNLTRDTGAFIEAAGFAKVNRHRFAAPLGAPFSWIIGPHIFGTAQKATIPS